jgi:transposase
MVFIDDATSTITSLHFSESESLEAYYYALAKHLKTYGIPLAFYGDRCATLNSRSSKKETTQFQRAFKELNCELILKLAYADRGINLEIIKRSDTKFKIFPKRWIVERTFSWMNRNRRLSKDCESVLDTTESWCYISMIRLMIKRISPTNFRF